MSASENALPTILFLFPVAVWLFSYGKANFFQRLESFNTVDSKEAGIINDTFTYDDLLRLLQHSKLNFHKLQELLSSENAADLLSIEGKFSKLPIHIICSSNNIDLDIGKDYIK